MRTATRATARIRLLAAWAVLVLSASAVAAVDQRGDGGDADATVVASAPPATTVPPATLPVVPPAASSPVAVPAPVEPATTTTAAPPPSTDPPPAASGPPPPPALAHGTTVLDRPGTWIVAFDGSSARHLTEAAPDPAAWWGDRLAWSAPDGETTWAVGIDGGTHTFSLSDPCPPNTSCTGPMPRRFRVLGAGAGRTLVSWSQTEPQLRGTINGLSTFGPDLREERQVGTYEYEPAAAIRPDGAIAVMAGRRLEIVDASGLTTHGPVELDLALLGLAMVSWSSAGNHVIVASPMDHLVVTADLGQVRRFGARGSQHHWTHAPDTTIAAGVVAPRPNAGPSIILERDGSQTELVAGGRSPHWHPSGDRIAFEHRPAPGPEHSVIDVIRPDGTGRATIAATAPGSYARLAMWSPDGRWLVVSVPGAHHDPGPPPSGPNQGFPSTG